MFDLSKSQAKELNRISPIRRDLMLRVINGDHRLVPVMFIWNSKSGVDEVLRWLMQKGMTGASLWNWITLAYGSNFHEPFIYILQNVDRKPNLTGQV